jgi:hypothetical protein
MVTLFIVQIQIWWAFFDMRGGREWNFFSFLYSLAIPVIGYLLCYLVVPALDAETVELQASYHENRAWFFGLVVLAFAVSFGWDLLGNGVPADLNTVFRLLFIVLALAAIRVRREWYHVVNAILGLVLFCAYVFAEFLQLR